MGRLEPMARRRQCAPALDPFRNGHGGERFLYDFSRVISMIVELTDGMPCSVLLNLAEICYDEYVEESNCANGVVLCRRLAGFTGLW